MSHVFLQLQLTIRMVLLDVIHKIPLLSVGKVTINAFKLFNVVVYFSVSLQCIVPGKKLATCIARIVPSSVVDNVNVAF